MAKKSGKEEENKKMARIYYWASEQYESIMLLQVGIVMLYRNIDYIIQTEFNQCIHGIYM